MDETRIWRLPPPISGGSADSDAPPLDTPADPGPEPVDTPDPEPVATEPVAAAPVESFINPADLPEEIKPHWKRMHRAYTKKQEEFKAHRADLEMLTRFRTDENYARELLHAEVRRRGLHLAPANGATTEDRPAAPAAPSDGPPARLVETIKSRLDPSLHWMAESLAAAAYAGTQEATRPLVEKDRAKDQAARDEEWGALAGKLTETAPGWEAHETDMNALLDFLRSPALRHPQFGDKLTFLYNAVTNGSAAKAAAIREMGDAARNATRTGQSGRSTLPNITDRVRKAANAREAMKVAAEEAERELRAAGVAIPD